MIKNIICIRCPNGCHLKVDTDKEYTVIGAGCAKGVQYGKDELLHPVRTVTSTVAIDGSIYCRLPVKTDKPIDKDKIMQVMSLLQSAHVHAPIKIGDVILSDILGTNVNIIACRNM